MDAVETKADLLLLFDGIIGFLSEVVPHHLDEYLNRTLRAIGKENYFPADLAVLNMWADSILKLQTKNQKIIGMKTLKKLKGDNKVRSFGY